MYLFLAFLPIGLLLFLMLKEQLPAFRAAPICLVTSIITGVIFFQGEFSLIINELVNATWKASTIILVVFTAVLIYEVTFEAKAFNQLKQILEVAAPNELIRILGLGMIFVSFLQGVTGFGVPIAVTAPLLIEIGVLPIWAVALPLIGHSWAGTFGTLAVAWSALVAETGITGALLNQTGFYGGMFSWIVNFFAGLTICWLYGRGKGIKKGFLAVLVFSIIQGGGQVLLTQVNGVIANFLPGCIALLSFIYISKLPIYKEPWMLKESKIMDRHKVEEINHLNSNMTLFEIFFPYIIMTVLTLTTLLIPGIKEKIGPLSHPSTFLLISAVSGYIYYVKKGYIDKGKYKNVWNKGLKKVIPSGIAILSLTMMSRVMGGTGQIRILAEGASKVLGKNYIFIAPAIGLLGTFITSSNMSSNILFSSFQLTTADLLSLNKGLILGAHTGGASLGTAISPSNIVLGATTANISGQEGKILKKILPFVLYIVIIFAILIYFLAK